MVQPERDLSALCGCGKERPDRLKGVIAAVCIVLLVVGVCWR